MKQTEPTKLKIELKSNTNKIIDLIKYYSKGSYYIILISIFGSFINNLSLITIIFIFIPAIIYLYVLSVINLEKAFKMGLELWKKRK